MNPEKGYFREDLKGYYLREYATATPSLAQRLRLLFVGFELHCVAVYRLGRLAEHVSRAHRVVGWPLKLLHRIMHVCVKLVHLVAISVSMPIGPGFHIVHTGGILVGARSIGRNCTIMQNVTIGFGFTGGEVGLPVIGDNVWIGPGAVVSGKIRIGNGATIAGNSVVARDVPEGCLFGGNPGRVLAKVYDNRKLFERYDPIEMT